MFIRYPPARIGYEGEQPVALLGVRIAPSYRLDDLPLGPPTTSARGQRGTWALYPPGEEVVVVHPDGAPRRSGDRTWSIPATAYRLSGPDNDHGHDHDCQQAGRFCISTATTPATRSSGGLAPPRRASSRLGIRRPTRDRLLVKEKRMKLRDIYRPDAVTIGPDHDLATAARPAEVWVSAHASFRPETAHVEEDSRDVARRMLELGVRHLPVTAGDDQLVGMVSMRDLLAVEAWM